MRRSAALYGGTLDKLGFGGARGTELIRKFATQIEAFGAHYVEEMRGIADGAELAVRAGRDDQCAHRGDRRSAPPRRRSADARPRRWHRRTAAPAPSSCRGAATPGRLIHGQNWDWRAECAETAIVLRVRRDDGPDFLTFVEAGGLARSGLNAAGIAITANYLRMRSRLHADRRAARADPPQGAGAASTSRSRSRPSRPRRNPAANNMMLSHADGVCIDFECAPDESFPVLSERRPAGARQPLRQHRGACASCRTPASRNRPTAAYRDMRVRDSSRRPASA